jgi:hypothetical protein
VPGLIGPRDAGCVWAFGFRIIRSVVMALLGWRLDRRTRSSGSANPPALTRPILPHILSPISLRCVTIWRNHFAGYAVNRSGYAFLVCLSAKIVHEFPRGTLRLEGGDDGVTGADEPRAVGAWHDVAIAHASLNKLANDLADVARKVRGAARSGIKPAHRVTR